MDAHDTDHRLHRVQQAFKWTIYGLLIVNFAFYFLEDLDRAIHTLRAGSTFLDWTSEFATSIDELAWFVLLLMFELETYVFEDEDWHGWVVHAVRGLRLLCYAMIVHTVFAFANDLVELRPTLEVDGVSNLCEMIDEDVSFVNNLEYTKVTAESCSTLSRDSRFYRLADDPLVTDTAGLAVHRNLIVADLIEAIAWLLILLSIETIVRLQGQGVAGGAIISAANAMTALLFFVLIAISMYWATLSHWLYVWDEFLWICGFTAIELNVRNWRDELIEAEAGEQVTSG